MLYKSGIELETCQMMSPLKWDMSKPAKRVIAREFMHALQGYQITRYCIAHYFQILKSHTQYCFAYISPS